MDLPIFSCVVGHHLCGSCKASKTVKVKDWFADKFILNLAKVCPICKCQFSGWAHNFENLVGELGGRNVLQPSDG